MQQAQKLANERGLQAAEAPLFPSTSGRFISKARMFEFYKGVAKAMGKNPKNITGHMPRVSGARRMTRAGVEL